MARGADLRGDGADAEKLDGRPLLAPGEFAAVVAMVLLTTVLTPPLLRWRLGAPSKVDAPA